MDIYNLQISAYSNIMETLKCIDEKENMVRTFMCMNSI